MGSLNRVIIIGRLGADVELKYTPSNRAVANLRIATDESYKDKSGQKVEKTEWHRVTVWGATAENAQKYLAKGREVCVEGRLETRSYDDKNGEKRYSTEIVADRVVFLGGGNGGGGQRESAPPAGGQASPGRANRDELPPSDDDIPF